MFNFNLNNTNYDVRFAHLNEKQAKELAHTTSLRNPDDVQRATVCRIFVGDHTNRQEVAKGIALCVKGDQFRKRQGLAISARRAISELLGLQSIGKIKTSNKAPTPQESKRRQALKQIFN